MCDKCREIVARIELYRRIMLRLDGDPQVAVHISGLIKEAEAEKIALHRPVQKPRPSPRPKSRNGEMRASGVGYALSGQ